ncbi:MAG TPA: hypothetical protein DCO79_01675, partial [Spirochaeta sp.]|nr:hypothetical protein [Spirochaeta sp.]
MVVCPPAHPNLPNVSWIIEYPGTIVDGLPVYVSKQLDGDTAVLIARGVNLPVFARPVFVSGRTGSFPAAAVYPYAVKAGRLELNWEDGFACEILRCCLLNSNVIRGFDTSRFCMAVTERALELIDDDGLPLPGGSWLLDPIPVTARLGYGLFRESSITAAETMSFSIPVSEGLWLSDNPLYPPVEAKVPAG